jgi:DNA-binding LacI/PurR family transcriptional regulator
LSVIGLRESPQSRSLRPLLTCCRTDLVELGSELAEALMKMMPKTTAATPVEPIRKLWPMTLVPGESDGPPQGTADR